MTTATVYDPGLLGEAPCPACKLPVYWAWDADMVNTALDPDPDGDVAVSLDRNNVPWCRDARSGQLALDESLYRPHEPVCSAPLATVSDLAAKRQEQRSEPERARRYA